MEHDTAGDPISGLRWTRKTTKKISRELRLAGIEVSAKTVARMLKQLDYSLRVNSKKKSHSTSPDRNQQFEYIAMMKESFALDELPVISVDTKKKELVGLFKNAGTVWAKTATPVKDHDFRSEAVGMAIPYGVFDVYANRGHIFVGDSHDTPEFAVTALARWWARDGRSRYPKARKLLILADNGGGNGARNRAWKFDLQHRFCNRFGVNVTVCHYPPGTSKWNPIEHRLFSEVSKNWAGQPLESYETMLKYIRTTTTNGGLVVKGTLVRGDYPTGRKISSEAMTSVDLQPHELLPAWNYTLAARPEKM
jgi:hypothetical protein